MTKLYETFRRSLRFPQALVWLLWIAFPLYGLVATQWLLPPEDGYTEQVIVAAFTADFSSVEPLVLAVFNLLGVIPMTYALLVLFDGEEQPLPAWPFVVLSFFAGAFGILFYVALRFWGAPPAGAKSRLQEQLDSWKAPAILIVVALGLVVLGMTGSIQNYAELWKTKPLVHVMTVDMVLLLLVLPFLAIDDMKRRRADTLALRILVFALPLLGVLIYLLQRPTLAYARK